MKLIDLGHDMGSIGALLIARRHSLVAFLEITNDGDPWIIKAESSQRPHIFDGWQLGDLFSNRVCLAEIVQLDRCALEELVVDIETNAALLFNGLSQSGGGRSRRQFL